MDRRSYAARLESTEPRLPLYTPLANNVPVEEVIMLRPRPLTHPLVALPLVPLLPTPRSIPLPGDIWGRILRFTMLQEPDTRTAYEGQCARLKLLRVCKSFKNMVSPMLYFKPHLSSFESFVKFSAHVLDSDRRWDNLRRIHHSTPGRWVQVLDLSTIIHLNPSQNLRFDQAITQLFTVLPNLSHFLLHPTLSLSRRAMASLADSEAARSLQWLQGIHVTMERFAQLPTQDPLTLLVRSCINLKHIEILGSGLDTDYEPSDDENEPASIISRDETLLPHLQSMTLKNVPYNPLVRILSHATLPSFRALTISLYPKEIHSDSTLFFEAHAEQLTILTLLPSQPWPSTSTQTPASLLRIAPNLLYLGLASECPELARPTMQQPPYPLRTLSIPRPNLEFLAKIVEPVFTSLKEVSVREVRYLRRGMGQGAERAGSSAAILEWKRRLERRGVRVLDALNRDGN